MFKRMFQFPDSDTLKTARSGSMVHSSSVVRLSSAPQRESDKAGSAAPDASKGVAPVLDTFDEVYALANITPPAKGYTILKIADMLNNRHLSEMTPDAKRNSLMMALESAEVEIGELLQDAVARNRALDEYEEKRQEQVRTFEVVKAEENNKLHAELERLSNQYMARIQANADQVAREQDNFRAWQKRKQQESQRITEAATFCVPLGNGSSVNTLAAVLERVGNSARK